MTDRPVPHLTLEQRRERTVSVLCDHYAHDRLALPDFESRLDAAHRARTADQLMTLLHDLPAPPPASESGEALSRGVERVRHEMRETRTLVAVMGGVERHGRWRPARRTIVLALMGGAQLDFRDVPLPPGETEIMLLCMMGGAEIIVPPELAVDASGVAILGGFTHAAPPASLPADAPILRISGLCLMGGVEISARLPNESARDARKRQRAARRGRRDKE